MAEVKSNILIVEDDLDVAEMLDAYFRVQGYDVTTANWGEDAVKICREKRPDLVILDIRLPDIDGYEVAKRIRDNRRTESVPIIFLTEKRSRAERLKGLELGADDYITKPFDIQELRLRVRNSLQRSTKGSIQNPVTNLPEGVIIDERLEDCLGNNQWALLLVVLEHLENFREAYGFVASDDVLRAVSLMIHNAVRKLGTTNDFIGHLNSAEFIVVTNPEVVEALNERISTRLEQSLDYFYPLKDREAKKLDKRLSVQISMLLPDDVTYKSIESIKKALYRQEE